jgi:hypothetical protein
VTVVYSRTVPGGRVDVAYPTEEFAGRVMTVFDDGTFSILEVADCDKPSFREAARLMGYGDLWQRYGVDHDVAHSFLAHALGWPFSRVVWSDAHKRRPHGWERHWPYKPWDEEHLVNRLQCYVQTGQRDTDYGILDKVWGDRLPAVAAHLASWLRPWTAPPRIEIPGPLDPDAVSFPMAE